MRLTIAAAETRVDRLYKLLDPCCLCPRRCGAHRLSGQKGVCGAGPKARIASWAAHRGEEPPISGDRGSGTLFASHCPMKCCFCQNFPFSQLGNGKDVDAQNLTGMFRKLMRMRVHNFNLVTAAHFAPQIFEAFLPLWREGCTIPVVYNTSGYESREVLELLDGLVDIYLPDIRYASNETARKFSGVDDYVERDRAAIEEMHRQVGELVVDAQGIAGHGLIIRHLVLPGGLAGTRDSFAWVKKTLGTSVQLSLMCQFFPAHLAPGIPELNREITHDEYLETLNLVEELGFSNVWAQDPEVDGGA